MRNGNQSSSVLKAVINRFLPYLWGMETRTIVLYTWWIEWFLPYLWGMETWRSEFRFFISFLGSYRTYEEWKLFYQYQKFLSFQCSYRTYEEWKLGPLCFTRGELNGSYRTYEEWKLQLSGNVLSTSSQVLTVPMRNGNNASSSKSFNDSYQFLPYLWGMETKVCLLCEIVNLFLFLPYLWGMETLVDNEGK